VQPVPARPSEVCYRHPDRPTRLHCSNCGRPICTECSFDAVVGQKCPQCHGPGQSTRVIPMRSVTHLDRAATPVAYALIAVNLVVFLIGLASPRLGDQMTNSGAQAPILVKVYGEWWRLFTAMFLHASIPHVLFNMYALWLFGPVLERRFGSASFGSLYLASGLAGAAFYQFLASDPRVPAIGASGAIFGLFGAMLAASYRQRHTRTGAAAFSQLLLLAVINLALPLMVRNIAWQAHVGGLVAGLLVAALWNAIPRDRPGAGWKRSGVALAVAAVALVAALLG
jgi:membrane associated rhomboid family serine protease